MNVATAPITPDALDVGDLADFPADLIDLPRFGMWVRENGTKVPYTVSGYNASSTNPANWTDFNSALRAYPNWRSARGAVAAGIGRAFFPEDQITGIDLDDCLDDTSTPQEWAAEIIARFPTYWEISPSGKGVKGWMRGRLDEVGWADVNGELHTGLKVPGFGPDEAGAVELYDRARYFAITGQHLPGTAWHVADCQAELLKFYREVKAREKQATKTKERSKAERVARVENDNRVARCQAYVDKLPDSIAGEHGSDKMLQAACETIRFDLSSSEQRDVLDEYNRSKCKPEWSETEIAHKIASAEKLAGTERGSRLRESGTNGTHKTRQIDPFPNLDGDPPKPTEAAPPTLPAPVPAMQLCRSFTALRRPIIHDLLRITEVLGIVGGPKTAKSWAALDLAVSMAAGLMWLDTYRVETGRVLYVDCELHAETFARRLAEVAKTRGVMLDQFADQIDVQSLRGHAKDTTRLDYFFRSIDPGRYQLVIIDPLYKLLPSGVDENSNSDIAQVYSTVDAWADRLGAGVVVIHHTSKGSQASKTVADTGSGASAQARSVDTHMVIRAHEEENAAVAEAITRSFPPPAPLPMRWEYPRWRPDHTLDPTALRVDGRRKKKEETDVQAEPEAVWTHETFAKAFVPDEPRTEAVIFTLSEVAGISGRKAKRLLDTAVETGVLHRWTYGDRKRPHRFAPFEQPISETGGAVSFARTPP